MPTLVDLVRSPGGQKIIVPNGTISAGSGDLHTPHSDWLILEAQTRHGVTVDLAQGSPNAQLKLFTGTSKVEFRGFKFKNGSVQLAGAEDITFDGCDFTYPPDIWKAQYLAAGGKCPANNTTDRKALQGRVNTQPTCIRVRGSMPTPGTNTKRLKVLGCDFHDITDDAMIVSLLDDFTYQGNRVWNVNEAGVDPGQQYGSSTTDWFHNDGLQLNGYVNGARIEDSWLGQKIQLGVGNDISDAAFRRLWLAGSSTVGMIAGVAGTSLILNSSMDTIRAFANGQQIRSHDKFRTDFDNGVQKAIWPKQYHVPGRFELPATNITTTIPPGITVVNGKLTNILQVRDHPDNPANKWRVSHPYATKASK